MQLSLLLKRRVEAVPKKTLVTTAQAFEANFKILLLHCNEPVLWKIAKGSTQPSLTHFTTPGLLTRIREVPSSFVGSWVETLLYAVNLT